jgi:8-oxo-dGTP pyrophosphatase MutT (NUDIX family)
MKIRYDKVVIYILRPAADGGDWEILQMLRREDVYLGGTWQFCSGGIEPGETAAEAAVREMREETGLAPRQFTFLSHVECFPVPMGTVWHRTGFCAVVGRGDEVQLNEEHTALRWIGRRDISSCVMWPGEKLALAEIFREHLTDSLSRPHRLLDPYHLPKPPPPPPPPPPPSNL